MIAVILGKYVLEALRDEAAFRVIGSTIRPVLCLVYTADVNAEQRIRNPAMCQPRWVREVQVDDQQRKD